MIRFSWYTRQYDESTEMYICYTHVVYTHMYMWVELLTKFNLSDSPSFVLSTLHLEHLQSQAYRLDLECGNKEEGRSKRMSV